MDTVTEMPRFSLTHAINTVEEHVASFGAARIRLANEFDYVVLKGILSKLNVVRSYEELNEFFDKSSINIIGGRLAAAINGDSSNYDDYDVLITKKKTKLDDPFSDVANMLYSLETPQENNNRYKNMSHRYFRLIDPDYTIGKSRVQIILEYSSTDPDKVVRSFDMCHNRMRYDIDDRMIHGLYPNVFCAVKKLIATEYRVDDDTIEYSYGIESFRTDQRMRKYASRGYTS